MTHIDATFDPSLVKIMPSGHLSYNGFAFIFAGVSGIEKGRLEEEIFSWADGNLDKDGQGRWVSRVTDTVVLNA